MNPSPRQMYRVADAEVDALSGRLRRDGEECRLREQSLQVFLYLVEHRERPVTKEELTETVWRGTAVTDDALVQCIVEIRKALGDDPRRSRFIKTIPKIGYRFIGPIESYEARERVGIETEGVTSFSVGFEGETSDQDVRVESAAATPVALTGAATARRRRLPMSAAVALMLIAAIALPIYLRQKTLYRQAGAGRRHAATGGRENPRGRDVLREPLRHARTGLAARRAGRHAHHRPLALRQAHRAQSPAATPIAGKDGTPAGRERFNRRRRSPSRAEARRSL